MVLFCVSKERYQRKTARRELKSSKIKNREEIEFSFYNKYFTTKINQKKQKVRYFGIYKVCNDNKNFYLYLDKTHAFIISKNGFIKGTSEEFEKFIMKKCRFKIGRMLKID